MTLGIEKYYVQLLGVASSEKVLLEKSLLIGSDPSVGLGVSHPHLSPEHCSINLQSGVLSIIDLNSDLGIVVNGKKIPANKMIIILPSDDIKIGDLVLKIHTYEDPALSEDHTTKILSLDDLLQEELKEAPRPTSSVQTVEEKKENEAVGEEKPLEMTLAPVEKKSEQIPLTQPVKQLDLTSTNLPKEVIDPLAKFKRGAKLPESSSGAVSASKKNLKKFQKQSSRYYFAHFASVSFPLRVFAFILDMILGLRLSLWFMEEDLMEFFSPIHEFINFSFDFVFNLHPDTAYLSQHFITYSSYFVGYLVIRVVGNLILGASPGQLLIGCWMDGQFTVKRILGPIRELLGFVLAPLIIFDLPSVFSKKTVKEMLTMTGLECYNKTLSYVLALTLIPSVFLLSFFSPLLFSPQTNSEVSIAAESVRMKIHDSLVDSKTQPSNFFRLEGNWSNPLFTSYLNFKEVNGKAKNKIFVPRITFTALDKNSELLVRLERKKEFNWSEQMDNIMKMYPVLSNQFSVLNKVQLKNSKDYSGQLKQIIQDSLELNYNNLIPFVFNYGPYIDPFLKFKNTLSKYFQGEIENVEFWKNADLDFMIVSTRSADVAGRWREFYILPLIPYKTYIYQCSYLKGTYPQSKMMMKQFFSMVKTLKKPVPHMLEWKGSELSSAELLDFYSLKSLTEQQKAAISPFIYRYYWNIAQFAVDTPFELFWADYNNNLRTAIGMLSEMNVDSRKVANPENDPLSDVGYDHLIKKLSLLREMVKNKQTTFFQKYLYP